MARVQPAVSTVTITARHSGKVPPHQGLRRGLVTVGIDPKHTLRGTDRHPQPLSQPILAMVRLIAIHYRRLAHCRPRRLHYHRQRIADQLLGLRHRP